MKPVWCIALGLLLSISFNSANASEMQLQRMSQQMEVIQSRINPCLDLAATYGARAAGFYKCSSIEKLLQMELPMLLDILQNKMQQAEQQGQSETASFDVFLGRLKQLRQSYSALVQLLPQDF